MPPRGLRTLMREEHARRAAYRTEDFCRSPVKRPRTVSNNKTAEPPTTTKGILKIRPYDNDDRPKREVKFNDAASQIHEYESGKFISSPGDKYDWILTVAELEGGTVHEEFEEDENTPPKQDTPNVDSDETKDSPGSNTLLPQADADFREYELYMKNETPVEDEQHVERLMRFEKLTSVVAQAILVSRVEPKMQTEQREEQISNIDIAELAELSLDWRTFG